MSVGVSRDGVKWHMSVGTGWNDIEKDEISVKQPRPHWHCANNPVNSVDYNGEAVQVIPFVIPLIIAAIPEETWEAAGQAVGDLISGATEVIKNTISNIKKKTSSSPIKIQSNFPRNNTVYTLRDIDGTVQYVGRTTNPLKRAKAHQANPARAELSFNVEHVKRDGEEWHRKNKLIRNKFRQIYRKK